MSVFSILEEIRVEPSTNKKKTILEKYKDNETLKRVLYLAKSKRVKFYIRQIPSYIDEVCYPEAYTLIQAMDLLGSLSDKTISGNAAVEHLTKILEHTSKEDAAVIKKIIDKDLKIGMGGTEMNKVFGKNFIEKTPYQGAKSYSEDLARAIINEGETRDYVPDSLLEKFMSTTGSAISQIKMDGRYNNAILSDGKIHLESRGGEPVYLDGAKFIEELQGIDADGIVLNGELTMDNVPRYASNGIIASCISIIKKRNEDKDISKELTKMQKKHNISFEDALANIRFTIWDIITVDEYNYSLSNEIYYTRFFTRLGKLFEEYQFTKISPVEYKVVSTFEEAFKHFKEALDRGLEGTILKSMDAIWKHGKHNWQIKMKLEMTVELEIVEGQYGKAGTKNENVISSLICKSSDGLVNTRTSNMKEHEMDYFTENVDDLAGRIITAKCCGLSSNSEGEYALLHPVFIEERTDKDTADSLETIKEIEHMALSLK